MRRAPLRMIKAALGTAHRINKEDRGAPESRARRPAASDRRASASGARTGSIPPRPTLTFWGRMPTTPHIEKHFLSSALVRDVVIGMADGLTVPFALAAGLSGAVSSTAIIVTAGLAEIAAGGLAMGLGGYLAARTDLEHYQSELQREKDEIKEVPETERSEVRQILREQGIDPPLAETVVDAITSD